MSGSECLRSLMITVNQCHKHIFFHSYLLNFKIRPTSAISLHKHCRGSVISLCFEEYSNAANACVSDDYLVHQNEGGPKGIDSLHFMEARCILVCLIVLSFDREIFCCKLESILVLL